MGLTLPTAQWICRISNILSRRNNGLINVCSLGYPDLLLTTAELKSLGMDISLLTLEDASRAANIRHWHGLPSDYVLFTAESFFSQLSANLYSIDIAPHRGPEIIADLGILGSTKQYSASFDLVIDNGTLEHCFNIVNAFLNTANLVKVGGYVFHHNPLNIYNHGFWSFNPTLYYDFYSSIGFEVKALALMSASRPWKQKIIKDLTARTPLPKLLQQLGLSPELEYAVNFMAKRVELKNASVNAIIQSKYKKIIL